MRYNTVGTLKYYNRTVQLHLDPDLIKYYRSLLPKAWYVKPPMADSHISVVRPFEEPNRLLWRKYEGERICVDYWLPVYTDGLYYWLDADSERIGDIREELGLVRYRIGNCYHITIGNLK